MQRRKRALKWGLIMGLLISIVSLSACQSVRFYAQVVQGHTQIMLNRKPLDEALASETDAEVRRKLSLVKEAREFAVDKLALPDNGSYRHYVDTGRSSVVWNVIATKAYSIDPMQHCFPVAGCVSYRGYYKKAAAQAHADQLKAQGFDTIVSGASAYSTLGWFSDPILNTMLSRNDLDLAGLIFHELAHQKIYLNSDTAFNESFATAVEREGVREWLDKQGKNLDPQRLKAYLSAKQRNEDVVKLVIKNRKQLGEAYRKADPTDIEGLKVIKKQGFAALRTDYKQLRKAGGGSAGYDRWFASDLNNASLVLFADYHGWVDAFERLFEESGRDWQKFYQAVNKLGAQDKAKRDQRLKALNSKS